MMLPIGKTWGKAVEHGGELDVTSGDLTHLFWWFGTKGGPLNQAKTGFGSSWIWFWPYVDTSVTL